MKRMARATWNWINASSHHSLLNRYALPFTNGKATIKLHGLQLSKPIPDNPIVSSTKNVAAAWNQDELRMVQDDLQGDLLPPRWVNEALGEDVQVLTKFRSRYNLVHVIEVSRHADSVLAGSRVLLLDRPGNIHSIHYKYKILTDAYYDAFAQLPPLLPEGPVGILGLGAGTTARVLHHFWPSLEMHGWELDPSVVGVARRYFDMSDLEAGKPSELCNEHDEVSSDKLGKLVVHVGDGLAANAVVEGGFAGIIVDLFSDGKVIPPLQKATTWENLKKKLKPDGRIMVNCGGSCVEAEDHKDGNVTMTETVDALMEAFSGEVSIRKFYPDDNVVVMTGTFPELKEWKRKLSKCLKPGVSDWRPTS